MLDAYVVIVQVCVAEEVEVAASSWDLTQD